MQSSTLKKCVHVLLRVYSSWTTNFASSSFASNTSKVRLPAGPSGQRREEVSIPAKVSNRPPVGKCSRKPASASMPLALRSRPGKPPHNLDERFFLIRMRDCKLSTENWTELERDVMSSHRWWSQADFASTTEQVWPENLPEILILCGAW